MYNRLFAWKGSFAVAGEDAAGCYVSNEFPCFDVNAKRLDAAFLRYYFTRAGSWTEALQLSSGATPTSRNRLKEGRFLEMALPLPPLAEQRRVVARIEALAAQVGQIQGLRVEQGSELRQLLWGAFFRVATGAPRRPMHEVAPIVRRPVEVDLTQMYPELGIRSFGRGTFHKAALSGADLGGKRVFWIQPGDLLLSNVFAWEGAIAVARPQDAHRIGSHRFITCVPRAGEATALFLRFFFLTEEGLDMIRAASPGGAGRNRTLGLSEPPRVFQRANYVTATPSAC